MGPAFIDEARQEKKPFFFYLAHNAPHFPIMAPEADIERYRGKYMLGWDKLRQARHERQIEMGLVDAALAADGTPARCRRPGTASATKTRNASTT